MTKHTAILAVLSGVAAIILLIMVASPDLPLYLRTQVVPEVSEEVDAEFTWTPTSDTPPGDYPLTLQITDENGAVTTEEVIITVLPEIAEQPEAEPRRDEGDRGGGDSGGGDSGGGDDRETPPASTRRAVTLQAESGHTISGSYSGVEPNKTTVVLAHARAILERTVKLDPANFWLEFRVKHDRPGPVYVAVYLNNRAWKVIALTQNDNQYRTHRVGLLRNFSGGKIRFRFLNDLHDKNDPTNADKDRNFHIDWWRLVPEG